MIRSAMSRPCVVATMSRRCVTMGYANKRADGQVGARECERRWNGNPQHGKGVGGRRCAARQLDGWTGGNQSVCPDTKKRQGR